LAHVLGNPAGMDKLAESERPFSCLRAAEAREVCALLITHLIGQHLPSG